LTALLACKAYGLLEVLLEHFSTPFAQRHKHRAPIGRMMRTIDPFLADQIVDPSKRGRFGASGQQGQSRRSEPFCLLGCVEQEQHVPSGLTKHCLAENLRARAPEREFSFCFRHQLVPLLLKGPGRVTRNGVHLSNSLIRQQGQKAPGVVNIAFGERDLLQMSTILNRLKTIRISPCKRNRLLLHTRIPAIRNYRPSEMRVIWIYSANKGINAKL
jgi:hypothetical protein